MGDFCESCGHLAPAGFRQVFSSRERDAQGSCCCNSVRENGWNMREAKCCINTLAGPSTIQLLLLLIAKVMKSALHGSFQHCGMKGKTSNNSPLDHFLWVKFRIMISAEEENPWEQTLFLAAYSAWFQWERKCMETGKMGKGGWSESCFWFCCTQTCSLVEFWPLQPQEAWRNHGKSDELFWNMCKNVLGIYCNSQLLDYVCQSLWSVMRG